MAVKIVKVYGQDLVDTVNTLSTTIEETRTTDNVDTWIASVTGDGPTLVLAPGEYVVNQSIGLFRRRGLHFKGSAKGFMEARGWGRGWYPYNPRERCMLLFDLSGYNDACFRMIGCRDIIFEGFTIARTTPGALFRDSNFTGLNSADMKFVNIGMHTRYDNGDVGTADPFNGSGYPVGGDISGFVGLYVSGNNGTDNYTFTNCNFNRLEKPIDVDSPQVTRMMFEQTAFRYCTYLGWCVDSANVSYNRCQRYDGGPLVVESCASSLTSVTWMNGWLDSSSVPSADFGMYPLVDFSRNATGRFYYIGGNGKTYNSATGDKFPLIVSAQEGTGSMDVHIDGHTPEGIPIFDTNNEDYYEFY